MAQCYSNATAGSINIRVDYLGDGTCRCFATSCNGVDVRCARPGTPAYAAAGTGPRIPLPDEEAFLGTAPNLRVTDFSGPANRLTEVYVFGRRILRVGREPGVTTQRRRTEDLAAGGLVGK